MRGWTESALMVLDIIEPISPLAAQVLWVTQPAAGLFGVHDTVGEIAHLLEAPDGVAELRQQLRDDST